MRKFMSALLAALLALPATAGTIRFDRDGLNARSTLSFRGTGNVIATVPQGTTGEVLERWELPSGNFGVKLRIQSVGSAGTTLKEGEEIWVYYHKDPDLRRVAVMDDAGVEREIDDENSEAKWAVALSSFKTRRQEKKPDAPCTTCGVGTAGTPGGLPVLTETLPMANALEVVDVAQEITETVTEAPMVEVSEQEMLTYLNRITDSYTKDTYERMVSRRVGSMSKSEYARFRKTQREKNPLIARTLLAECKKQNVPVELGLALMRAESGFIPGAKSSAGARGLMQLMPGTYDDLSKHAGRDKICDVELNTRLGISYFAKFLKTYGGNYQYAAGAYNAGPKNMEKYLAAKRKDIPSTPYLDESGVLSRETMRHMQKMTLYGDAYAAFQKKSNTLIASN